MQTAKQLFEKLTSISAKDFYQVEADLFMLLQEIPVDAKSDVVVFFNHLKLEKYFPAKRCLDILRSCAAKELTDHYCLSH